MVDVKDLIERLEAARRQAQEASDFWQARLLEPQWHPDQSHIEQVAGQLRRTIAEITEAAEALSRLSGENADLRCLVATYSSDANEERSRAETAERQRDEAIELLARIHRQLVAQGINFGPLIADAESAIRALKPGT